MNQIKLNSLYQHATRELPNHADLRLGAEELLALAAGQTLPEDRQAHATAALAASSQQAAVLRLLRESQSWSEALAADLTIARRSDWRGRLREWLQHNLLPPTLATAAVSALALAAWQINQTPVGPTQVAPPAMADVNDNLFGGDFDQAIAHHDDGLFGGDFDS